MNTIRYSILSILLLGFFSSCLKEYSLESNNGVGHGSLQSDAGGDCLPKTVMGAFIVGKALTDSNFIQVDINVSSLGSYQISTPSVNGYLFEAAGSFTSTGINTIKFKAKGTPLSEGADAFVISYDSSVCIIEVSVLPASAAGPAVFALQGSPGSCLNATVNGVYGKNTELNSSNKVDIEVNVTTIGVYNISTTPANGMTFASSGTFATTGIQTVSLSGSGTPMNTGATAITVNGGPSSCSFTVNVSGLAAGTLAGSPAACMSFTVNGSYTKGTPLTSSNTVQIQLNVTTAGAYTITTNNVSGISFSKSGTLTATGSQFIILDGAGTPSASGTATISVTFGGSSCTFPVTINGTGTPPPTSTYFWKFTEAGFNYQGSIEATDAELITTSTPLGTLSILAIIGTTSTGDTLFNIALTDLGGGISNNETYNTSSSTNNAAIFQVNDGSGVLYEASASTTGVNVIIKITNHNTSSKIIDGTFSGTAKNGAGVIKTIAGGQFKCKYQ